MLNIVIPVYNEGENIAKVYQEIRAKIATPHQIMIVYDMDDDDTLPVVRELQKTDHRLVLIKNIYGGGVLNAIKSGFHCASDGPCLVLMGDLSDDLSTVEQMVEKYNQGYKVVCGSRYMKGGRHIGGPFFKKLLSRLAGMSLHFISGIPTHDVTNNFKLYDKALIEEIDLKSRGGLEIAMEITVKAYKKGYPICEVPTIWNDRTSGKSRFRLWKWLPYYLKWYLYALF